MIVDKNYLIGLGVFLIGYFLFYYQLGVWQRKLGEKIAKDKEDEEKGL